MEKIQVLVILTCMYTLHMEDAPSMPHVPQVQVTEVLFPTWVGDHIYHSQENTRASAFVAVTSA